MIAFEVAFSSCLNIIRTQSPRGPEFSTFSHGSCQSGVVTRKFGKSTSRAASLSATYQSNDKFASNNPRFGKDDKIAKTYVTVETAQEMMQHAVSLVNGDLEEVVQACASGFVEAFTQCYNSEEHSKIFMVIGHGTTGLLGLFVANELKARNYEPFVYASNGNKHVDVAEYCQKRNISTFDFIPSTLSFYFDVVVDALLGTGFDGGDIRSHYWSVFEMLISTDLPIASVDVPSGWDLTLGPREIDLTADTFVKPELLVSLGAPKLCAKRFAGEFHFIAGRLVPQKWFSDRDINVPSYLASSNCALFQSNANAFGYRNGEVYNRPGQFNATLFTKNPRRTWVDVEEDDELWDELD